MNVLIRGVRGTLVVVALAAVGLALRWMTDGSLSGVRTYDLQSLTVLAIGTVAWIAYGWFVLAIALTVLEQIPGAIGALASLVAGRITSTTARTLLRSSLGLAAVTPLTVASAHATPATDTHSWSQLDPSSPAQLTGTSAERPSTIRLGARTHGHAASTPTSTGAPTSATTSTTADKANSTAWRSTEPRSTVQLGAPTHRQTSGPQTSTSKSGSASTPNSAESSSAANAASPAGFRSTEPRSTVQPGAPTHERTAATPNSAGTPDSAGTRNSTATPNSTTSAPNSTDWRSTEPPSTVRLGQPAHPAQSQGRTNTAKSGTTPSPARPTRTISTHPGTAAIPDLKHSASNSPDAGATNRSKASANNQSQADADRHRVGGVSVTRSGTARQSQTGVPRSRSDAAPEREDGVPGFRPDSDRRGHDGVPGSALVDQGRRRVGVPDRPTAGAPTRYTDLRSGVPVRVTARVVVRPGDSLWSIAARELGADASAEAIDTRWPQWYAANRDVIGPDPDLILPGQVLRTPPAATGDHVPPTSQEK